MLKDMGDSSFEDIGDFHDGFNQFSPFREVNKGLEGTLSPSSIGSLGSPLRRNLPIIELPATTFASLLSGPLVHITVGRGDERREWHLHRNLLEYYSTSFARDISLENSKTKTLTLELPDDAPAAFELLVKWLYQGSIDDVSALNNEHKWDYAFACQQLYTLCERLELLILKNAAIDQFRKGCHEAGLVPGPEEMLPVYEHTAVDSPFRKLVSRIAARQILDPESGGDATRYRDCFQASPDFAIDVVNAIRDGVGGRLLLDPTTGDPCEYHQHIQGATCPGKLRGIHMTNGILKKKVTWQE